MIIRSYSELSEIESFEGRYQYLKLKGEVGLETFGFERYINQRFYRSAEWKSVRTEIIARDLGRDLGVEGFDIHDKIIIHHMNPMVPSDIINFEEAILDPEYLISTSLRTHNAIHYGNESGLLLPPKERTPGDTKLW